MHYKMLLVTAERPTDATIKDIMAPYCEEGENGKWDWYQIGGRYSGALDGYDPEKDPANIEVCSICNGTGMRDDALGREARAKDPSYTCNSCDGNGMVVKWPTQWARHPGDTRQIKDVDPGRLTQAYAFMTVDARWRDRDDVLDQKQWQAELAEALSRPDFWVTVIDYHM